MIRRWGLLITLALGSLVWAAPADAATIKVNTTADEFGTGTACSLREAVTAANGNVPFGGCARSGGGADVILLRSGKTYLRTITGTGDDNFGGDLDVFSKVSIRPGDRTGRATVDAAGLSRVIDLLGTAQVTISRVNLVGGIPLPGEATEGGGVRITADARLTLSRSSVSRNEIKPPTGFGAGIENHGVLSATTVKVAGNKITGTGAANGAGIESESGSAATLDRVVVTGNEAANVGGGIATLGAKLEVTRSTISGNDADYAGGGVYVGSGASPGLVTIRDSTISGNDSLANSANTGGGGVMVGDFGGGKTRIFNTTVSGNSARGSGGGMFIYAGQVSIFSSTIAFNTGDSDGDGNGGVGGIAGFGAFANSIVAANKDLNPGAKIPDCRGASSAGNSLIGEDSDCPGGPTDITGKAPKLTPLAANGGPTATHVPKAGSPAINRGSAKKPGASILTSGACTARDQRGIKRPQGRRCDIGAVERRLKGQP